MTSQETLYTKNAANDHSFPLVTHTAYFNTWFGRYGFLKSGYGAELFWTAWTLEWNPSFMGPRCVKLDEPCLWSLKLTCSVFQRLLLHMILATITMVMTIQRQRSCAVSGLPKTASSMIGNPEMVLELGDYYDF
jgi:hypothetical protein